LGYHEENNSVLLHCGDVWKQHDLEFFQFAALTPFEIQFSSVVSGEPNIVQVKQYMAWHGMASVLGKCSDHSFA
jgi:hypothetical protein